jgi:hypothetical protein
VSGEVFWHVVFWGSFVAFTAVSLLVAVKGIGEIRDLLRALGARDRG